MRQTLRKHCTERGASNPSKDRSISHQTLVLYTVIARELFIGFLVICIRDIFFWKRNLKNRESSVKPRCDQLTRAYDTWVAWTHTCEPAST